MSRLVIGSVLVSVLAACSQGAEQQAVATPPAPAESLLSGVVGHWSDTTIDMPAIVANGERWSGQHSRSELEQASQRLFGAVSDSFLANASAAGAFPHAVASSPEEFRDGTLRVQFNLVGGESDQIAGILFGLRPTGEYFYVRYNTKDGNVAVWKFAGGERTVLAHGEVHRQLPLGTWQELVVEVQGRRVRGYVAGDTTISVGHTLDVDPSGRVGVWVKRDAITAFRGFAASPR